MPRLPWVDWVMMSSRRTLPLNGDSGRWSYSAFSPVATGRREGASLVMKSGSGPV